MAQKVDYNKLMETAKVNRVRVSECVRLVRDLRIKDRLRIMDAAAAARRRDIVLPYSKQVREARVSKCVKLRSVP